jgi:hypothetical protein
VRAATPKRSRVSSNKSAKPLNCFVITKPFVTVATNQKTKMSKKQNPKRNRHTITFQPTEDVRRLLASALSKPDAPIQTDIINAALRHQLDGNIPAVVLAIEQQIESLEALKRLAASMRLGQFS